MVDLLDKEKYDLENILDDEDILDAIEDKIYDFKDVGIISLIDEVVEDFIPSTDDGIWNNARAIKDYTTDAISNGMCEGLADIENLIQNGYYWYYKQLLLKNIHKIIYNCGVNYFERQYEDLELNIDEDVDLKEQILKWLLPIGANSNCNEIQVQIDSLISRFIINYTE